MKNTTDITNIGDVRISIFKYVLNISPGGRKCAAKGRRIFAGGLLDYFCFFLEMGLVGGQFHHKSRLGGAQGANRFVEMVQAVSSRLEMTAPTPLFDVVDPFGEEAEAATCWGPLLWACFRRAGPGWHTRPGGCFDMSPWGRDQTHLL